MYVPKDLKELLFSAVPPEIQKIIDMAKLLTEIIPPFEIRLLKLKDKEYIAILFERPQKEAK